jgi:hypothetical protein
LLQFTRGAHWQQREQQDLVAATMVAAGPAAGSIFLLQLLL